MRSCVIIGIYLHFTTSYHYIIHISNCCLSPLGYSEGRGGMIERALALASISGRKQVDRKRWRKKTQKNYRCVKADCWTCVCVCKCISMLSSHATAMGPVSQQLNKMQNMIDEVQCAVKNGYVKKTASLE